MVVKLSHKIFLTIIVFVIYSPTVFPAELSQNIIVIAQHGSLEDTPENTFAAFNRAINKGVGGLEIDVRKTKDDMLILMHDETIDRTTDGKGYVGNLLYEEIKLYDAGSWKGKEFTAERVPLLSDVLQLAKEKEIKIVLNVKEHGIEQLVLSHVEELDMMGQIYFSGTLKLYRNREMDLPGSELVFVPTGELDDNMIDFVHEKHKHVGTSLVGDNRFEMMKLMIEGVDVILTDYPSVALDLLNYEARHDKKNGDNKKENKLEIERSGNEAQVNTLINVMKGESPDQSRMAALAMRNQPKEISIPPLLDLLTYKKSIKRFNPIRNIMSPFKKKEKEDSPATITVRRNAAWSLGLIGDKKAVGPLIKQLETVDSEFKREIILALMKIADRQAVKPLNEILLNDKDPYVRYDAARALGGLRDDGSVYPLISALKSNKEWIVKAGCVDALGKFRDERVVNALKNVLTADAGVEASWVRDRAAWALSELGNARAIDALVSSLGDNETNTRRRAGWALIKIGNAVVPHLTSTLRSNNKFARARAAFVLGWIGNKRAVNALSWALKDESPMVRKWTACALGKIGGKKAEALLKEVLQDHNENVVECAREAIQRIRL